ncbi:hypothetical protein ACFE04_015073 [Oxalis oulophora]
MLVDSNVNGCQLASIFGMRFDQMLKAACVLTLTLYSLALISYYALKPYCLTRALQFLQFIIFYLLVAWGTLLVAWDALLVGGLRYLVVVTRVLVGGLRNLLVVTWGACLWLEVLASCDMGCLLVSWGALLLAWELCWWPEVLVIAGCGLECLLVMNYVLEFGYVYHINLRMNVILC